jgi:hypothetical protein
MPTNRRRVMRKDVGAIPAWVTRWLATGELYGDTPEDERQIQLWFHFAGEKVPGLPPGCSEQARELMVKLDEQFGGKG